MEADMASKKPGLYANIHAKQQRIAHGSGEKMRSPGEPGAPKAENFENAEHTAKPTAERSAKHKPAAEKATTKRTAAKKSR